MSQQKGPHHDAYCHQCRKWVQRARHHQHDASLSTDPTIPPAQAPVQQAGLQGQAAVPPGPAGQAVLPAVNCAHRVTKIQSVKHGNATQTIYDENGKVTERRQYQTGMTLIPTCAACGVLTGPATHEQFPMPAFPARGRQDTPPRSESIKSTDDANDNEEDEEDHEDADSVINDDEEVEEDHEDADSGINDDEELEEDEEYEEIDGEDEQETVNYFKRRRDDTPPPPVPGSAEDIEGTTMDIDEWNGRKLLFLFVLFIRRFLFSKRVFNFLIYPTIFSSEAHVKRF